MLFKHYDDVVWDKERWPNFSPDEPNLHCPCCGEFYHDEDGFDKLQAVRTEINRSLKVNSGHRCVIHNARVLGKPMSQHLKIAFDLSLKGQDPETLIRACVKAGFTSFGFYGTFLHVDSRPGRVWWSNQGKKKWGHLITKYTGRQI